MPLSTIEITNKIFSNMNIFELELPTGVATFKILLISIPINNIENKIAIFTIVKTLRVFVDNLLRESKINKSDKNIKIINNIKNAIIVFNRQLPF